MSDLPQDNPRSNPYFQDRRIRRFLIRHGFINRHGDILPPSSSDAQLSRRQQARDAIEQTDDGEPRRLQRSGLRSLSKDRRLTRRAKSSRFLQNRSARRSAKSKSPEKTLCRVIMTYIGPQTTIEYDKSWFQNEGDEIVVMQQHCGGENLTVFKGFVKPQETFAFDSKRHSDYPFALALYINGLIDCRVSVCCEYKHKKNVPLGGPSGSFAIANVQKVKPCRSCRFERLKKKSKSTISLVLEPSRYERSVVPVPPPRLPSPPTSTTQGGPSPNGHRTPTSPRPRTPTPPRSRTPNSPLEEDDKKPTVSSHPHASTVIQSPSVPPTSPSSAEADDKKPLTLSTKLDSPVVKKTAKSKRQSSAASPSSTSSADDKKPPISSVKHSKPTVRTDPSTSEQSPDVSRTPTPTLEADDKRPPISSAKRRSPVVPTGRIATYESPDVSRTPTPTLDADDKRPPISSARRSSPVIPKSFTSIVQNPVISQKNNNDNENYEPDFSESNDDEYQPSSSRFGRPRISDPHLSDKDQGGNNNQLKHSWKRPSFSDSTDDQVNRQSSKILNGKENTNVHSRKTSSSSSRKSGPSEDEDDQYTPRILNGGSNVAENAQSSSSRKSGPSSPDKMKSELNTISNYDRFPSIDDSSKPKIEENRRATSSSSEDFFGIKRSSTKEKNKTTQGLATDWFETNSRNDPNDNDHSPRKTKSWEKLLFSDDEK